MVSNFQPQITLCTASGLECYGDKRLAEGVFPKEIVNECTDKAKNDKKLRDLLEVGTLEQRCYRKYIPVSSTPFQTSARSSVISGGAQARS